MQYQGTPRKKSSTSSRPTGLKTKTSKRIGNRQLTKKERNALRRAASRQPASGASLPRLTGKQLASALRLRDVGPKLAVSVRLDPPVVAGLKSKGPAHITRINHILTNLMEAERRLGPKS
jgi:uncharacterized protein (DUF4415 family)